MRTASVNCLAQPLPTATAALEPFYCPHHQ